MPGTDAGATPGAKVPGACGLGLRRVLACAPGRVLEARDRLCAWFFSDAMTAAAAWCLAALALAAVLAWFFVWSPFGAPAAPVYAEF